jgi:hypothetical protein
MVAGSACSGRAVAVSAGPVTSRAGQVASAGLPARGRPRGRISLARLGSRPASASARRSRNSIWALVLRSSSLAHRARASWTAGSNCSRHRRGRAPSHTASGPAIVSKSVRRQLRGLANRLRHIDLRLARFSCPCGSVCGRPSGAASIPARTSPRACVHPAVAGRGHGPRHDQVIYYQYRADRARRTLRGVDEQVAKAEKAVAGKAAVKRSRFIRLSGGRNHSGCPSTTCRPGRSTATGATRSKRA